MKITWRAARINRHMSRETAAEQLGIAPSTLGNYERGETYPDLRTLCAMMDLYGVTFEEVSWQNGREAVHEEQGKCNASPFFAGR